MKKTLCFFIMTSVIKEKNPMKNILIQLSELKSSNENASTDGCKN